MVCSSPSAAAWCAELSCRMSWLQPYQVPAACPGILLTLAAVLHCTPSLRFCPAAHSFKVIYFVVKLP